MNKYAFIKVADSFFMDLYLFNDEDISLKVGDYCVIQTKRGMELGKILSIYNEKPEGYEVSEENKILRIANNKDLNIFAKKKYKEESAKKVFLDLVKKHNIVLKLTRVEYIFDRSKVIFYYTADGRVDFRALVKDLATVLKTRIEMRQIGVRDEAKMRGDIGRYGRILCCSTFMREFKTIPIKAAKDQSLTMSTSRLSGICGRLMCCLMFEKHYEDGVEGEDVIVDEDD